MSLRSWWRQYRARRVEHLLASSRDVVLEVLRREPALATDAIRGFYATSHGFLNELQEMDAARARHGPARESYQFPQLSTLGFGGKAPLQKSLPKLSSWNLRRFSEICPPARRAINAIKLPILDLPFTIGVRKPVGAQQYGEQPEPTADQQARIKAATAMFLRPNDELNGREFLETGVEDLLVLGGMCFENRPNRSDERPLFLWPVDTQSVRMNVTWTPGSREYRYSQGLGYLFGTMGTTNDVQLQDEDLCYAKLNPRSSTPFGLGSLEIAFQAVNAFLGAFEYADRRAANSTPSFLIFLGENVTPEQTARFRHYWENEIEGYGKAPIVGGGRAPAVHPFTPAGSDALWLQWQEWLVRIIAMSFGISPMRLGMERDINRSTAEQGASDDWATIAPVGNTVREAFTHWVLWKRLGWTDLEFTWQIKMADEMKQAQVLAVQWESDGIYVDELRAVYERPPLPDGLGQMTMTAYQAAVKAAVGMPGQGAQPGVQPGQSEDEGITPFDDLETNQLTPQEQAFVQALMREKRRQRAVAG
jgi:hypothetical protein